ncbi:MAG TPA: NAD(P)-dependent oxidoreductase [Stellaceae bacterium]|nr:NAD(P)-dependent oxidoreductase [Stellaceae bacterium]
MTVLITGGTGFVGLGLADRLTEEGGDIILFAAAPPPEYLRRRLPLDRVQIALGDIRSVSDINAACRSATIDLVFHLAAVTAGPAKERDHPDQVLAVNVEGTAILMKTLARSARPRRIVVASSGSAYGYITGGPNNGRLNEQTACPAPTSIYGISKLAGEGVALRLGELYGLEVRVARLGTVYGPWEYPTGVREVMSPQRQILQCLAAGRTAVLPRPMKTDWIYVRDVARGLIALAQAPALEERLFNLGGGEVFDLLGWCQALAARRPGFSWRLGAPGETANIRCNPPRDRAPLDSRRITEATGFAPAFDLAAAADDYLAWFESLPPHSWTEAS